MNVVHTKARIGEDRILRIVVPDDSPIGEVTVTLTIEAARHQMTADERLAAANAGAGALEGIAGSVDDFLAERREDERRRDRAFGL